MIATIFVDANDSNKLLKSEMSENDIYKLGDVVVINDQPYNVSEVISDNYPDYSSILQYIKLVIAKEFEDIAGS